MEVDARPCSRGVLELRSLKHRVDLHAIDETSARRRGPRPPSVVPAGTDTDFYHPDDDKNKDDGLVPFGNPDGVRSMYWACGDSAFDAVFEVLLEHMSKEEWAMFGTEFIKIAWTDDMSREMKLRGFLRTLSRCLTVAAETTRQHVMMACFPSPNSSAWNGSGASTFTPSTRRVHADGSPRRPRRSSRPSCGRSATRSSPPTRRRGARRSPR